MSKERDNAISEYLEKLTKETGVVGIDRLAALFARREPLAAGLVSLTELKKLASEVLKEKARQTDLGVPCAPLRGWCACKCSQ